MFLLDAKKFYCVCKKSEQGKLLQKCIQFSLDSKSLANEIYLYLLLNPMSEQWKLFVFY